MIKYGAWIIICVLLMAGCGGDAGKPAKNAISIPPAGSVISVTDPEYFNNLVFQSPLPVVAWFYSDQSVPCRVASALFDSCAAECTNQVIFARINLDDHHNTMLEQQYTLQALPTLIVLHSSLERARVTGAISRDAMAGMLNSLSGL